MTKLKVELDMDAVEDVVKQYHMEAFDSAHAALAHFLATNDKSWPITCWDDYVSISEAALVSYAALSGLMTQDELAKFCCDTCHKHYDKLRSKSTNKKSS